MSNHIQRHLTKRLLALGAIAVICFALPAVRVSAQDAIELLELAGTKGGLVIEIASYVDISFLIDPNIISHVSRCATGRGGPKVYTTGRILGDKDVVV